MKPPVTSDCSLAPKLLFVDWLKILANEKQAVQFRSPLVLVCEQKRCSHMPGAIFLVKFDFFKNNPDFVVFILIFPSMTLWNVARRALLSYFLCRNIK